MRVAMIAALAGAIGFAGPAFAIDKVTFGTNWVADPEAGGYYQALVDGTYAKYGLDVTILQGGPMSNGGMLLIAGKIEFFMGGDMIGDFLAVQNNIPTIAVAAHFQKNPQIFMSHPGVGLDKWTDLPTANPAFVSAGAVNTFWAWMRLAYGFKDENIKPYNFNSAPFIAEPHSIQQGYLTSEPLEVEKQGGFKPNVFLLADYGYSTYSTLVETRRDLVEKHPDIVQRFVDASTIGWYHYLYGDNSKANEAIKTGESGNHRRRDRLLDRQNEGIWHRRFRRHAQTRDWRDDRRTLERFLQCDGEGGRRQAGHRLQEGLHASSSSTRAWALTCVRSDAASRAPSCFAATSSAPAAH